MQQEVFGSIYPMLIYFYKISGRIMVQLNAMTSVVYTILACVLNWQGSTIVFVWKARSTSMCFYVTWTTSGFVFEANEVSNSFGRSGHLYHLGADQMLEWLGSKSSTWTTRETDQALKSLMSLGVLRSPGPLETL